MALFDFVQSAHGQGVTPTSVTVPFSGAAGLNNIIIAFASGYNAVDPFVITDDSGINAYTQPFSGIGYTFNGNASTINVTASCASSTVINLTILEIVGDATVVYDTGSQTLYAYPGSYSTLSSGAITTTGTGDGLVGAVYYGSSSAGFAEVGTPNTFVQREHWFDGIVVVFDMANTVAGGPGTCEYAPTLVDPTNFALSHLLAFKSGGSPSDSNQPMMRRWGGRSGAVPGIGQSSGGGKAWG